MRFRRGLGVLRECLPKNITLACPLLQGDCCIELAAIVLTIDCLKWLFERIKEMIALS